MKYFVIVKGQDGRPHALIDEDGSIHLFEDEDEAEEAASSNLLGANFGYEIVAWEM